MSSLRMTTPTQQRIMAALSRQRELSNAQVAAAAECSEAYASRVLRWLERQRPARVSSRVVQDANDPQTHYRLWRLV